MNLPPFKSGGAADEAGTVDQAKRIRVFTGWVVEAEMAV
jgi:hypothetical protein